MIKDNPFSWQIYTNDNHVLQAHVMQSWDYNDFEYQLHLNIAQAALKVQISASQLS